jgi:LacI family repressor for deo operon, udp, cdd, tsx, nupC, and nupG
VGVTIRDIAREAGVSTATVSRALRGLPNVDPRTLAKVMSVVERWDYVVSPTASRLASGRTGAVAALTPHVASWYFATLLFGAEPIFQTAELDLLLFGTTASVESHRHHSPRRLRRKVDGFLVLGPDMARGELDQLLDLGLPVVVVGALDPRASSVFVDDVQGAQTATNHLIELGHERIGLIAGHRTPKSTPDRDRREGFARALSVAGLGADPELVVYGSFSTSGAEAAATRMLSQGSPPTAIFAISDEMAIGAIRAIRGAGLTPGVEVSVVGYDGHELADVLDLTTMAQPVEVMGGEGARLLVDQLRNPHAATRQVQFSTELIPRKSTGPPTSHTARRQRSA